MTTPLLFNATAGRGKLAERLRTIVAGRAVELVPTNDPAEMRRLCGELAATNERLLVAGGDGTVHHALRGLNGCSCVLGLVPIGTGNDFAAVLGLSPDPEEALGVALQAPGKPVDLGRAGDTPFGTIAGVGIVADVLTYLESFTRTYRGNWVYPWAVVRTVLRYRPLAVTIESDSGRYSGPAMIAAGANTPRFGGGMRAAPEASVHDGALDVVILTGRSKLALIRLLPRVYRGTHLSDPACTFFRTREFRVVSTPGATVYADGEALPVETTTEATFRAVPDAVRIAV